MDLYKPRPHQRNAGSLEDFPDCIKRKLFVKHLTCEKHCFVRISDEFHRLPQTYGILSGGITAAQYRYIGGEIARPFPRDLGRFGRRIPNRGWETVHFVVALLRLTAR
jgi:hypothetical protein